MPKENEALVDQLKIQHNEWLSHPMTQQALGRIKEHEESFVKLSASDAMNPQVTDAVYRYYGINIRNTRAIISLLTNADIFLKIKSTTN